MRRQTLLSLVLLSGLALLARLCVGEDTVELSSLNGSDGKKILSWSTSVEDLRKRSSWELERGEIPLSPHQAAEIASAWLQKRGEVTNEIKATSISLLARYSPHETQWHYNISVRPLAAAGRHSWAQHHTVIVLLDGTVVEPQTVDPNSEITTNAMRRVPFRIGEASATSNATPAGVKGNFETVQARVLRVFAAEDNGAKFRAYLVKWNDLDVIVQDPLATSDKKEGETITFMAGRTETCRGEKKPSHLYFFFTDFEARAK